MAKKVLLLMSHYGSDFKNLFDTLNENPRIQGHFEQITLDHPNTIINVLNYPHKENTTASIYMFPMLLNPTVESKAICKACKFIYLIRPPAHSISAMVNSKQFDPQTALDYYIFRLRKLAVIAKETPGAVFLTWDNLYRNQGLDLIEEYLNLKTTLGRVKVEEPSRELVHQSIIEKGEEVYERHYKYFKSLNLIFTH